jgi:WhiB family redox-sensing transcriptional regulator
MTTTESYVRPSWDPSLSIGPAPEWNSASRDWREEGICSTVDPEIFFPPRGASTVYAKKVCRGCPVKDRCLATALENDERFGIWGGYSERERRKMKSQSNFTIQ